VIRRAFRVLSPILIGIVLLLSGCGASQQLHIESDPSGAEVYLMRRGEYEISGNVDGFAGSFEGETFEEDFYLLGSTPLEYEFDLSDTESAIVIPGVPASATVTKIYQEGILRVVRDGYITEERTIQFSNNVFHLVLDMDEEREDPSSPDPREAGDEDEERGDRD
jgi:hypothetical protein